MSGQSNITEVVAIDNRKTKWMRWIARIIGSLAAAFFLLVSIGEIIFVHAEWTAEGAVLGSLVLFAITSIVIAWRWEGIGGTAAILAGIALGVFAYITAGHNNLWIMLFISLPYVIPGILFLVSWSRTREQA